MSYALKRIALGCVGVLALTLAVELAWADPIWTILAPANRFRLSPDGQAVLDKETLLLWEQTPDGTPRNWSGALTHCLERVVSGRLGWRVPTAEELLSLKDPAVITFPTLPAGHPFSSVQVSNWSATTVALIPSVARLGNFNPGVTLGQDDKVLGSHFVWCVRGGSGNDSGQ